MKRLSLFLLLALFAIAVKAQNSITQKDIERIEARADTLFAHEDYQMAFAAYGHLAEVQPTAKVYRRMGWILTMSHNMESQSIDLFKKAIMWDKDDQVSYWLLGNVYAGLAAKEKDPAKKAENKALAADSYKHAADLGSKDAKAELARLNAN